MPQVSSFALLPLDQLEVDLLDVSAVFLKELLADLGQLFFRKFLHLLLEDLLRDFLEEILPDRLMLLFQIKGTYHRYSAFLDAADRDVLRVVRGSGDGVLGELQGLRRL